MELGIKKIESILMKKEEQFDLVHSKTRTVVRSCSNAIKSIHGKDIAEAKKCIADVEEELKGLKKYAEMFKGHIEHILQEYVEAKVILAIIEGKKIPTFDDLKVPPEPYLCGLLDATGEIKREMYESLRHGDKKKAEKFFETMEEIYNQLIPLRFSNSVLPEFRRKQDVARMQIEQARGELL
ncbi:MAG: RNA-binding protein [Candidatus Micrarchaeota archaeon]